jgi:hypothetical protein
MSIRIHAAARSLLAAASLAACVAPEASDADAEQSRDAVTSQVSMDDLKGDLKLATTVQIGDRRISAPGKRASILQAIQFLRPANGAGRCIRAGAPLVFSNLREGNFAQVEYGDDLCSFAILRQGKAAYTKVNGAQIDAVLAQPDAVGDVLADVDNIVSVPDGKEYRGLASEYALTAFDLDEVPSQTAPACPPATKPRSFRLLEGSGMKGKGPDEGNLVAVVEVETGCPKSTTGLLPARLLDRKGGLFGTIHVKLTKGGPLAP